MIEFYKDNLVPPELCRLLYEVVPKRHHLPVRFHNRRSKDVHEEARRVPIGSFHVKHRLEPSHININLNPIYDASWWRHYPYTWVPSAFIWRHLIEACLHEFGHMATWQTALRMNQHEYFAEYGRVHKAIEQLADGWRDWCIARILKVDSRLGQPKYITGYLGALLVELCSYGKEQKSGRSCSEYIKEARCRKTGGQLTSGNVLAELKVSPEHHMNAYDILRKVSDGIGINYVDGIGRRHKLYTWGDVPILAKRLKESNLLEKLIRRDPRQGLR